ncbi:MAG: transglycosylase SLT domain-containing protein [Natronohydrobacter sp.]|nr:transglycosylase SLT domain-containing protein [Natronohydrobacter sp.]
MCLGTACGIIAAILLWPSLMRASNPAHLCDTAARAAAMRHNVPLDVLRAVALTETGRMRNGRMEPWPWALNMGGPGFWPDTRAAALTMARAQIDQGRRNIDLGCFQVNFRWHGQNFASLDDMIDPEKNADYAARLLSQHKSRLGTWDAAAGAYHSGTQTLAARYIERFRSMRATTPPEAQPVATGPLMRENTFSLLQPGGEQRMGSLVPLGNSAAQPLIQFSATQ